MEDFKLFFFALLLPSLSLILCYHAIILFFIEHLDIVKVGMFLNHNSMLLCYTLLGGMMTLSVREKTNDIVKCKVIDGGELKSRRHLNVRGKSATLPSITGWSCSTVEFTSCLNLDVQL